MDDDEDDKEIFCLALQRTDPSIGCITASDGLEALAILKDRSFVPDFIFIDLNMPVMNGKECLKEIRKLPHLDHIAVIMISTSSADKDKEETKGLGANAFITKPPLIADLSKKLSEIFSNP